MYGIDVSKWQKGLDFSKAGIDFCIIKATEGVGYVDPCFSSFVKQCKDNNILIGCYHYARPDIRPTEEGMRQEAREFVREVKRVGIINSSLLFLDWEGAKETILLRKELVDAFMDEVKTLTGKYPILYASMYILNNLLKLQKIFYKIWAAQWPDDKEIKAGYPISYSMPKIATIWQYSSTGVIDGWSGNIDLDFTLLLREEWEAMAAQSEILSNDMKWAIENKLFVGYGDGTYSPKQCLTREQAATLLHRFYNMIKEEK